MRGNARGIYPLRINVKGGKLKLGKSILFSQMAHFLSTAEWGSISRQRKFSVLLATILSFGVFFAAGVGKASAATYYVSNTTSNGYITGNDSNTITQAQNKSAPWATITHANAVASTGDIIYVNAGTYAESNLDVSKGLSFIGDNGSVILQNSHTNPSYVIFMEQSTTASFTNFTFDGGNNVTAEIFRFPSTAHNKTFTNCIIQNVANGVPIISNSATTGANILFHGCSFTQSGGIFLSGNAIDITIEYSTLNITNAGNSVLINSGAIVNNITFDHNTINLAANTGTIPFNVTLGTYIFTNNTWNISGDIANFWNPNNATGSPVFNFTGNTVNFSGISSGVFFYPHKGTWAVTINNNNITITNTGFKKIVIMVADQVTPSISGNTIDTTATTLVPVTIQYYSTGAVNCGAGHVDNNIIKTKSYNSEGGATGGIIVGQDSTVANALMDGSTINGNTIYGPIYYDPSLTYSTVKNMELIRFCFTGNMSGTIANNVAIGGMRGITVCGGAGAWSGSGLGLHDNLFINNGQGIVVEGPTGVPIYNNTVYSNVVAASGSSQVQIESQHGVGVGGAIFRNNIVCQTQTGAGSYLLNIDPTAIGHMAMSNNLYYSTYSHPFFYNNTNYDTLSSYQTASGLDTVGSTFSDPKFTTPAGSIFTLQPTSSAINAGTNDPWSGVANVTDFAGTAVTDWSGAIVAPGGSVDIGAYEYIDGNGVCGSNNTAIFYTLASGDSHNCSAGIETNFTGSGPWTWYCAGINGGTDSGTCSATLPPPIVINPVTATSFTSMGGLGTYTWSIAGSPPWLTIIGSGRGNSTGIVTLTGLPANDPVTIQVTDGYRAASITQTITLAVSAPGAPAGVAATAGNGQATVSFAPPLSDGGSPITSYTVTSSPGNITATGGSSPITVTGLTNGTAYTFTVTATNTAGTGSASAPSESVTPSEMSQPAPVPAIFPIPLAGAGLVLFMMLRRRVRK